MPERQIKVRNIDIGCEEHKDGFSINWDGKLAITIKPGESAVLPLYLGMHFAEQLAQHLLIKEASESGADLPRERKDEIKNKIIEDYEEPEKVVETIPKGVGHVVED